MDDQERAYLEYCSHHNDGTAVPFETFKNIKHYKNGMQNLLKNLNFVKHEK